MKIYPVGTGCSLRTDGQTDMAKLIVPFRNFANARINELATVEGTKARDKIQNDLTTGFEVNRELKQMGETAPLA